MWFQDRDHFLELLIGHGAKDDPDAARIKFLQECRKRFRCRNVMRAVEQKASAAVEIVGVACLNLFERDLPMQLGVLGDKDFAQAAAAAGTGYDALIQQILDAAFA